MPNKPSLTLSISPEEKERIRAIAASLGFTIGRGSAPEQGSIQKLNRAIANGIVKITKKESNTNDRQ